MLKIKHLDNKYKNKKVDRRYLLAIIDEALKIKYPEFNRLPGAIWREVPKFKDFPDEKSFNEYNNFVVDKISFNSIRNQIDNFSGDIGRFYDRIHKMFQNCRDFNRSDEDKPLRDLSIRFQNDITLIIEKKVGLMDNNKIKTKKKILKRKKEPSCNPKKKIPKNVNTIVNNHILFQNSSPVSVFNIDGFDFIESKVSTRNNNKINSGLINLSSTAKKIESINKDDSIKPKKIGMNKKIGIVGKLKKIIRIFHKLDDSVRNKFNNFLESNNFNLIQLHYFLNTCTDVNQLSDLRKKINDINNFLSKLINDNKEKESIEKEVNNCLQSIISTLEYPERFKVIQNIKYIKKNLTNNKNHLKNLKSKYESLFKQKEKLENDINNITYESGKMRNEIFKLKDKFNRENPNFKSLIINHKRYLAEIDRLSKENSKFKKSEETYKEEIKKNNKYKENLNISKRKLDNLKSENKKNELKYKKLLEEENKQRKIGRNNKKKYSELHEKFKKTTKNIKQLEKDTNILFDKHKLLIDSHKDLKKKFRQANERFLVDKHEYKYDYYKFNSVKNEMIVFNRFRLIRDSYLKKLEEFKEYQNSQKINYSNSSSDIEVVNSMNIPDRCKICAKHYKDPDFSGMCVAFPCGHTGICLSCVNKGYKNKCDGGKHDKCFMRNCCSKKCFYTKVIL